MHVLSGVSSDSRAIPPGKCALITAVAYYVLKFCISLDSLRKVCKTRRLPGYMRHAHRWCGLLLIPVERCSNWYGMLKTRTPTVSLAISGSDAVEPCADCITDNVTFQLSQRASRERMPHDVYWVFLASLRMRHPFQNFHSNITPAPSASSILIDDAATFFDHVIVHGHRRATTTCDSLALIRTSHAGLTWAGLIEHIVTYQTAGVPLQMFAFVRWFHRLSATRFLDTPWASL